MRNLKKFEDIKIPINVGDTILGGRFKNKKVVVKKIGKNAKGDITINGKPLLKFRISKKANEEIIYDVNDPSDKLYFIIKGKAKSLKREYLKGSLITSFIADPAGFIANSKF